MKYYLFSLGCKVNSYEMSSLAYLLNQKGYKEDKENPDVVIINTCSVTSTADQKSRQHIRKFQKLFPSSIIVVMGCYAQKAHAFIFDSLKADIVTGTSKRKEVVDLIEEIKKGKRIDITEKNPRFFSYEEMGLASYSENVRAYLKIQDGCDNFCSYCLIPFVRGKSRSREMSSIIKEAKFLVEQGYKEIVLTGIHVGGYGKDLENTSFSLLVEALLDIPSLYRLRISSIEESEIDDHLIYLLKTRNNLACHLHIPLQAGDDNTLKRMNRKYNQSSFLDKINKIKASCPHIALTTDVIVGFPGESDEEFNNTKEFIKKCGFNMLHVFPFSSREGTLASRMDNQISPEVKKERSNQLLELSSSLWNSYTISNIGKRVSIIIERISSDNYAFGHTSNYLELKIPNRDYKIGEIVEINITKDMIVSR